MFRFQVLFDDFQQLRLRLVKDAHGARMLSWLGLELAFYVGLQSLWAGYGHICGKQAKPVNPSADTPTETDLVPKLISPPGNPRDMDEGHLRKMFSYQVEQPFYCDVAPSLGPDAAVARCLASTLDMDGQPRADELRGLTATLMTDLRPASPAAGEKRAVLSDRQVYAALGWLANFHRRLWDSLPVDGLGRFHHPLG